MIKIAPSILSADFCNLERDIRRAVSYTHLVERRHFHSHTAGSLTPTFVTARLVSLAVRLAYAFTLFGTVSGRTERTFERLRYAFGGDRPSQTAVSYTHLDVYKRQDLSRPAGPGRREGGAPQMYR